MAAAIAKRRELTPSSFAPNQRLASLWGTTNGASTSNSETDMPPAILGLAPLRLLRCPFRIQSKSLLKLRVIPFLRCKPGEPFVGWRSIRPGDRPRGKRATPTRPRT